MVATMYAADGVGLAACQIGVDRAVFVFDCPDDEGVHHRGVVCNPVLLPSGGPATASSTTATRAACRCRAPSCRWRGRTSRQSRGRTSTARRCGTPGTGLLARCLQHETDHCQGTVFGDRLNRRARKKLHKEHDEAAADFPADWPVSGEGWGAGAE